MPAFGLCGDKLQRFKVSTFQSTRGLDRNFETLKH